MEFPMFIDKSTIKLWSITTKAFSHNSSCSHLKNKPFSLSYTKGIKSLQPSQNPRPLDQSQV